MPLLCATNSRAGDLDGTRFELHDEKQQVADGVERAEGFDGEEVAGVSRRSRDWLKVGT
jgi:hypothetical protein